MAKGLLILLDGLGDRPSALLGGMTPLEAAETPVMDALLAAGSCGLVDPLSAGLPVDTHTGSAALMGAARRDLLTLARGPVEAAGVGADRRPGDVFLRANFATLEDDGLTILDRRAGRISRGTDVLAAELQDLDLGDGITASVFPATEHRAVVRLRGEDLSADISDTDPGRQFSGAMRLSSRALNPEDQGAQRAARALNRFLDTAFQRLREHPLNQTLALPANALLTRGAGSVTGADCLLRRLGLKVALISGERTLHGLARMFGFSVIHRPGFTASSDTDLAGKFTAALTALENQDLVYLHIKATDIFSHNKDPLGKRDFLQSIDRAMRVLPTGDWVIGITGDHSTDSTTGNHCGDPVPSLLSAPGCRIDGVRRFSESHCCQGGLSRLPASGFLFSLLDLMGCLPNYHPFDALFIDHPG